MATKKREKSKNKFERYFLLSGKKIFAIMIAWFSAAILHNLTYAFFVYFFNLEFEEPFFFLIATIIIPIYLIMAVIYSLRWTIKNKKYPEKGFYIKSIISLLGGLLITFILIYIDFLNGMYFIPITVFTLLIFGLISLFQKTKRR